MLRKLIGLTAALAIVWSLWWIAGAAALQRGLDAWIAARRAEGWAADAGRILVTGYPLDFVATLTGLELADPATGLAWTAPEFRFVSRAWNPVNVAASWPGAQVVATPEERIDIASEGMEAALVLFPGPALALSAARARVSAGSLVSTAGWRARVAEARLDLDRLPGEGDRYDLAFRADAIEPAQPLLDLLDPQGRLPRAIALVSVEATVGFDRPWDRRAIEERRPQPVSLRLSRLKATWGRLDLEAAGALAIDAAGMATGEIQVRAVNWREMLALGRENGLVPPELAGPIESGLDLLAAALGNPRTLELPLTFREGRLSLGPVPLGPAPRFVLR
ncbi:MAG: DUF2125 domain-containing protein [Rhodobacteraceae bacterium]|nr:DUF2125 domain-containing protein [Paracoccaceae bacterium]